MIGPPASTVQRLIAIGASTGGPPAVQAILRTLTDDSPAAVVIAQHMPQNFTASFAERLHRLGGMRVCEAQHNMRIEPGCAYVAPGGQHLEVAVGISQHLWCRLYAHDGADRWVPSVDRLFTSSRVAMGSRLMAVVLTGMGWDGSAGVRRVAAGGGQVICESEATAAVFGMPKEAASTGCATAVLALPDIIERVHSFARGV
jgi:two-component system chemotaxis response regulator CheB